MPIWVTDGIVSEYPLDSRIHLIPTLSTPANGTILHESTVTLFCKPHPNSIWAYHIQIATDRDFNSIVSEHNVPALSLSLDNLPPGEYFWRMRGTKGGRMPSDWSGAWSFTIAPPDSAAETIKP